MSLPRINWFGVAMVGSFALLLGAGFGAVGEMSGCAPIAESDVIDVFGLIGGLMLLSFLAGVRHAAR